jgi:dihydrodipicolinate synthase/N-acetylneuraminate lyase
VEFLSHHPNIYGIKDSERDMERMKAIVEIKKTNPDFAYFCGWAAQSVYSLSIGGDGIVPSTGNFVPKMFADLYDAVECGNKEEAQRLQEETNTIAKIYQEGRTLGKSLAALKIMMHTLGLCSPYMFRPLNRLSEEEEKKVAQLSMAVKF